MTFSITNTVANHIAGASFSDLTWGMANRHDEIDTLYAQHADELEGIQTERALREMDREFTYDEEE